VTVVELVTRDHDEIAALFARLAELAGDDHRHPEPLRIAARLVAAVRTHVLAEEHVVYEALRTASPELRAFALAGPHEHEMLDITIDKLLVRRPGDEYGVIVRVARDLFEMHARDEEEAEVLPAMLRTFSAMQLVALGEDLAAEQARLRPRIDRQLGLARAA
jgi:hypothetical protein